jgi:hypothetical protein
MEIVIETPFGESDEDFDFDLDEVNAVDYLLSEILSIVTKAASPLV